MGDGDAIPGVSNRWQAYYSDPRWDDESWVRYARGLNAHVRGDLATAETEYTAAVELAIDEEPPIGALRGRALLAAQRDDEAAARERYAQAVAARPDDRLLVSEAVAYLLDVDDAPAALEMLDRAPSAVSGHGRNRLLRARALLATGDRAGAAALLDDLEVPDLAEGGRELDELWTLVHPDEPLPARLDFRMHEG